MQLDFEGPSGLGRSVVVSNQVHQVTAAMLAVTRRVSFRFSLRYFTQSLLTTLPLFAADLAMAWLVLRLTAIVFSASGLASSDLFFSAQIGWGAMLIQPLIGALLGLYPGVGLSPVAEFRLTTITTSLWMVFWLILLTAPQAEWTGWTLVPIVFAWTLGVLMIPIARAIARRQASRYPWWGQPAVILGGGSDAITIFRTLQVHRASGLRPLGIIDHFNVHLRDHSIESSWYLGPPAAAERIAEQRGVFWGVVPVCSESTSDLAALLDRHAALFPHLLLVRGASTTDLRWHGIWGCDGLSTLRINERLLLPPAQFIKRGMDIILTLVGGFILLPLIATLALAVRLSSPGPIFYGQQRLGIGGRIFRAWKFRSMVVDADAVLQDYLTKDPALREEWNLDHKLKRDPRVTPVGHLLRKASLDELPQLWNVLRGEMSLVGPRPIVDKEIQKYGDSYNLYLRVRPGITGLWQVSGRNNTTYEERVKFDSLYARNWSPWFDFYLLARTVRVVLLGEGAY